MPVCKTQLHNLEYYQGRWTLSTWHQHFFQIHEISFLFRKRQAAEWFAEDKLDKCLDTKPIKQIKNRNFTRFTCIYLYCPMAAGDEKRWKTEAGWEKTETDGVPVTAWERDTSGEQSASISTACAQKDGGTYSSWRMVIVRLWFSKLPTTERQKEWRQERGITIFGDLPK